MLVPGSHMDRQTWAGSLNPIDTLENRPFVNLSSVTLLDCASVSCQDSACYRSGCIRWVFTANSMEQCVHISEGTQVTYFKKLLIFQFSLPVSAAGQPQKQSITLYPPNNRRSPYFLTRLWRWLWLRLWFISLPAQPQASSCRWSRASCP